MNINCQLLESGRNYDAKSLDHSVVQGNYVLLTLDVQSKRCLIGDTRGFPLLHANSLVTEALIEIALYGEIAFDAYVDREHLFAEVGQNNRKQDERNLRLHANIYGPKHKSDFVGASLSGRKVFLQDPLWRPPGIPYHNPHIIKFDNVSETDIWLHELMLKIAPLSKTSSENQWSLILDDLPQYSTNSTMYEDLYMDTEFFR